MTRAICKVPDCIAVCFGHGYCNKHYKRWRKYGDVEHVEFVRGEHEFCTVVDCTRPHQAGGLCRSHYARYRESGVWPETPIRAHRRSLGVKGPCQRPGCEGTSRGSGYCDKHYSRLRLMLSYGCSGWEQVDALLELQGFGCAICKTPLDVTSIDTHIDHCHTYEFVRGILCRGCNHGLGHFQDDPAKLRAAADYLEQFPSL